MRLAFSNIAWDVLEDESVAQLLAMRAIDAIDVAPSKYFSDPNSVSDSDILMVKSWWAKRGVEITGMQALLFGTQGLNVFGPAPVQTEMLRHLDAICRIGGGLGATRLVFGSPKNRDRTGLSDREVLDVSIPFFQRLGNIAQAYGVIVCLEPNPPCYGANFMTNSAETAEVVMLTAHASIKMQLDIGALDINGEDADVVLKTYADLIGHIHASERDLVPLGDSGVDHKTMREAIERYLPTHVISIEMLATKNEPHLVAIDRALEVAIKGYRSAIGVRQ